VLTDYLDDLLKKMQSEADDQQAREQRDAEFAGLRIVGWAIERQVDWYYIAPGKPTQNAFIESFNPAFPG
jgi:transposase InsO family protein